MLGETEEIYKHWYSEWPIFGLGIKRGSSQILQRRDKNSKASLNAENYAY
jgi:hypothetical protein